MGLPVRAGARVELSTDAWLAALDASTATVIVGPTPPCGGSAPVQDEGGGGGCGSSFSGSALTTAPDESASSTPAVQVVSQGVVGPYESVTVRSSQGEALGAWLTQNGYDVPASNPADHRRVHGVGLRLHRPQAPSRQGRAGDAARARGHARRGDARFRCGWSRRGSARTPRSNSTC